MLVNTSLLNLYGINMNVELDFTDSKTVLFLKNEIKPGFIKKKNRLAGTIPEHVDAFPYTNSTLVSCCKGFNTKQISLDGQTHDKNGLFPVTPLWHYC